MIKPRLALYAFIFPCLFLCATCQSDIETAEHRDEHGRLERYQRRKKDFAKEGLYQRFHEKGYLMEEAHYTNDTLDGERKFFYPNGQVERIEHFRRGMYAGKFRQYYENGRLQLEQEYVDGALEGLSTAWYPNGVMKEKVTLRQNEENGPFTEWYENGKLKAVGSYIDGDNEQDSLKLYDTLGQLERVLMCQMGACRTVWVREGVKTPDDD